MSFDQYLPIVPDAINQLQIRLTRAIAIPGEDDDLPTPPPEVVYGSRFFIELLDAEGNVMDRRLSGSLDKHLTPAQKAQLKDFIDALWQKAESEILGS